MLDKSPKFIYVKSELLSLCMNEVMSQNRQKISKFENRKYLHKTKWQIIRVGVSYFVKFDLVCHLRRTSY